MKKTSLFLPIRKVDEEQRLVYGVITEETLDKAGEVLDYAGSKPLFEKWSHGIRDATDGKSHGNVRVMHTNKVAGILSQELVFDDDAKTIEACAKVIDDNEWAMVLAGGYTGFSIGGRYVKRWKEGDVQKFIADPSEVSLVDNPCVGSATFSLVKADGTEVEQEFQLWQPTNTEVATKATELAKAAGDEAKWTEHLEEARAELMKAHAGEKDEDDAEDTSDEEKKEEDGEDDDTKGEDDGAEGADDKKKAKKAEGEDGEEEAEAEKSAPVELSQVWQTTDSKTFVKKADAVAHQATIDAAAEPENPLQKAIDSAKKAIAGETEEEEQQNLPFAELGAEVQKYHGILVEAHAHFADHCVAKGLYTVGRLGELMESLGYVLCSTIYEREAEKDASQVPEQIMSAMKTLGDALIAMAQEEVAEMIAEMNARGISAEGDAAKFLEAHAGDKLEKAGNRHNKTDKEKLKEIQRLIKDLGVEEDDETTEKLAKLAPLEAENASLRKMVDDAVPQIEQLVKDVELLKAAPMPSAPRTRVVGKGEDSSGIEDTTHNGPMTVEKAIETFGADALANAAIKSAQARPIRMVGMG